MARGLTRPPGASAGRSFTVWRSRLRPHVGRLLLATLAASASAAVPGLTVWMLRQAVVAVSEGNVGDVGRWVGTLVVLSATGVAVRVLRTTLTKGVAWRIAADLRTQLHARWLAEGIDGAAIGDRVAAVTAEVDQVQYGVSGAVTLLRDPLTLIGLAGGAMWAAPGLAPWVVLAAMPVVAVAAVTSRWVARAAVDQRQARAELTARVTEQLVGWEVIDLFGAHRREGQRFAEAVDGDRGARVRLDIVRGLPAALAQVVALAAGGALLVAGAQGVATGTQDAPGLVALTAAVALALRPLGRLSEGWSLTRRATAALARVEAELQRPAPQHEQVGDPGPPAIRVTDAEWWQGERLVLGPLTMTVRAGEVVAVVGPTGAGKTSLLRLIAGVRSPTRGSVEVGGVAVAALAPEDRAARVTTVPQDGFLFARTIADNLRLGAPGAGEDELWTALEAASARFVGEGGLDRALGPSGAPLSGGERQRLGLARALVTTAGVILLDEPTNQVDPATEAAMVDAISRNRGRRTVVVASHDRRVALAADRVVVLVDGRIVQQGVGADLAECDGPFRAVMGAA